MGAELRPELAPGAVLRGKYRVQRLGVERDPRRASGRPESQGRDRHGRREIWPDALDGQPRFLEPGKHSFRYDAPGAYRVVKDVEIVSGQKDRKLTIELRGMDIQIDEPGKPPPAAAGGCASCTTVSRAPTTDAWWALAALATVGSRRGLARARRTRQ